MEERFSGHRGCLLGMAIGDALGYTVDDKTWEEIQDFYGPNGLMGFDLQDSEFAQVSSYTQIAAFLCNSFLLAVSRGKTDYLRFAKVALREWTRSQQYYRDPEESYCWIAKLPQFRQRHCRDARMLSTLRLEQFGTIDSPQNHNNAPGLITAAVATALFYNDKRLTPQQVGTLAGELIALTHGDPETFLCGVVLAYAITGILQEPRLPLLVQFQQAIEVMDRQFRSRFFQAEELAMQLQRTIALVKSGTVTDQEGMEQLECMDTAQCLSGAIFACLMHPNDFDSAIVTAVNHSGLSAATGAMVGAIMGAKFGESALPEFYLESLECTEVLGLLAEDIVTATPTLSVFDDSWDHKYVQGMPPEGIR